MQRLEARLTELARAGETVTYGTLARDIGIRIGALTEALEVLMAVDVARGVPLRAALCEARLGNGLPAPGFFECAERLGVRWSDPVAMVAAERAALFSGAR